MESREHPLQHWTPDVVLNRSVMSDSSCDPVDCSPPGKNTGVAMPSSRGSSQPRDWTQVSRIAGRFFTLWATREARDSICQTLERHANYREMSCNRDRVESSLRVGDFLLPSFEWKSDCDMDIAVFHHLVWTCLTFAAFYRSPVSLPGFLSFKGYSHQNDGKLEAVWSCDIRGN